MVAFIGVIAAVVLATGYVSSASALQEDLQGTARYVAQHAQSGDAIALPDHAITAAFGYYLASDDRQVSLWPQLGVRQRFVEGFDLSLHASSTSALPNRVWMVMDGSVAGFEHFEKVLRGEGYVFSQARQFPGVTLLLYHLRESLIPSVLLPTDGAAVSGNVVLAAALNDATNVKRLEFQATGPSLHNAIVATARQTQYAWVASWDSTKVANGLYLVRSAAVRSDGMMVFSSPVRIHIENK